MQHGLEMCVASLWLVYFVFYCAWVRRKKTIHMRIKKKPSQCLENSIVPEPLWLFLYIDWFQLTIQLGTKPL